MHKAGRFIPRLKDVGFLALSSVIPSSVTLAEGASTTVEVEVQVPGDAGGDTDITTVSVTSQDDGSVSDSATDTTTASEAPTAITLASLTAAGDNTSGLMGLAALAALILVAGSAIIARRRR